jgi:sugar lactone lactonase YvrE
VAARWLLLSAVAAGLAIGGAVAASQPNEYVVPGVCASPYGVAFQEGTSSFYVTSACNGAVYRGHLGRRVVGILRAPGQHGSLSDQAYGLAVDRAGRLFVATPIGILVYSAKDGSLVKQFITDDPVHHVALARDGYAYFASRRRPLVYRVRTAAAGRGAVIARIAPWLNLDPTALRADKGQNFDGIAATDDGRYLVAVRQTSGELFRIGLRDRRVTQIGTTDVTLTGAAGVLLRGRTLYVVRTVPGEIVRVPLNSTYTRGGVTATIRATSFGYPTTAAFARGRLLVANSRVDEQSGVPALPYTVSAVRIP